MNPLQEANQKIENRIAEIMQETEYQKLKQKAEKDKYLENDFLLKTLTANRDASRDTIVAIKKQTSHSDPLSGEEVINRLARLELQVKETKLIVEQTSSTSNRAAAVTNTQFYNQVKPAESWILPGTSVVDTNAADWQEFVNNNQLAAEPATHNYFHDVLAPAFCQGTGRSLVDGRDSKLFGEGIQPDEFVMCEGGANGLHVLFTVEMKRVGKNLDSDSKGQAMMQGQKLLDIQRTRQHVYTVLTNLRTIIYFKVSRVRPGNEEDDPVFAYLESAPLLCDNTGLQFLYNLFHMSNNELGFVLPPIFPGITVETFLGSGATSVVFKVKHKNETKALKLVDEKFADELKAEISHLEALADENLRIPKVTKIQGTDLAVLLSPLLKPIKNVTRRHVHDLFATLARVHKNGIVHRDIRKDNILEDNDGHAYLIDFGFAIPEPGHNTSHIFSGAVRTASDNVLDKLTQTQRKLKFTIADDVVSLVRTLYILENRKALHWLPDKNDRPELKEFWTTIPPQWKIAVEMAQGVKKAEGDEKAEGDKKAEGVKKGIPDYDGARDQVLSLIPSYTEKVPLR